jgi:hypothetical protein
VLEQQEQERFLARDLDAKQQVGMTRCELLIDQAAIDPLQSRPIGGLA